MTQPEKTSSPQKKTRRTMLEEFVAAHAGDPFALYGLAIECASEGDSAAAQQHFEKLLADHPDYVTGYFQYGQLLARLSRNDEARRTLNAGIAVARRTGNDHAALEMESALSLLPS